MAEDTVPDKQEGNRNELGRFVPGVSGNPLGRPHKEHSITAMIQDMMSKKPEIREAIGQKILQLVLEGDTTTIRTLWGYMDGLPEAKVKVDGTMLTGVLPMAPER